MNSEKKRIFSGLAVVVILLTVIIYMSNDPVDDALDKYEQMIEEIDRICGAVSDGEMTMDEFNQEYKEFLDEFDSEDMDVFSNIEDFSPSQLERYHKLEEKFKRHERKYNYW